MKKRYLITTLLVVMALLFAACDNPVSPETPDAGTSVDKSALNTAITDAETLLGSVSVGIEKGNVSQDAKTTYAAAIASAKETAGFANTTQAEIDNAVTTLATATTAFNAAIIAEIDKEDLDAAILYCIAIKDSKTEGAAAGNVAVGSKTTFEAAITAAQAVADDVDATTSEAETAVSSLVIALEAFYDAILMNKVADFDEATAPGVIAFGDASSIIDVDPADAANKVMKFVRPVGAQNWAGSTVATNYLNSIPKITFTSSNTVFKVRVYSPEAGLPIMIKLENAEDPLDANYQNTLPFVAATANTTVANSWETLVFEISHDETLDLGATYNKFSIFLGFLIDFDSEKVFYVDDIEFGGELGDTLQELTFAIADAKNLRDSVTVGDTFGCVPLTAFNTYNTAISNAEAAESSAVTQADFDAAVAALDSATTDFIAAFILPVADTDYYIYSTASPTADIDSTTSNWGTGEGKTNFSYDLDLDFNPSIEATDSDNTNMWDGGTPVAVAAFEGIPVGTFSVFTHIEFKIKTARSTIQLKLQDADGGFTEVYFDLSTGSAIPGTDGWIQMSVPLTEFTNTNLLKANVLGFLTGWGGGGGTFYLTDVSLISITP